MPIKELPHSVETEVAVLGAVLLDNAAFEQLAELDASEFFLDSHRVIFTAMREMAAASVPVDLVTLCQRFMDNGQIDRIGGAAYLASFTDGLPRLSNVGHYVKVIKEKAAARRMMLLGRQISEAAESGGADAAAEIAAAIPPKSNGTAAAPHEEKVLRIPEAAWCDVGKVYLEAVRHTTSASENYHFAVFLTIAGAMLGRRVYCGDLFPNFFTGLIGESSYAKKGTAMRYGKWMMRDAGMSAEHWLMSMDSSSGFVREMADLQTAEKSKDIWVVLHQPELSELFEKGNREGSDIFTKLTVAYDCEDLSRAVALMRSKATNTFTAVLGGADPGWLEKIRETDLLAGIGNRFCWIPGEEREPLHKRPPIDRVLWNRVVKSLHDMKMYWAGEREERLPSEFTLSDDADELMEHYGKTLFHDTHGDPMIRKLCGRMEDHCKKTALVYAALERTPVIERVHLEKAITFCEFLLKGLYLIFSKYGLSEIVKQERRMVELITQAGGVISQRTLQRKLPRMDGETFQRRLRFLIGEDNYLIARRDGKSTILYLNH